MQTNKQDCNHQSILNQRYDFVYLFDVADGNPSGDPDAGNLPRLDPQTVQGFVTDVCIKRKIRNAIPALSGGRSGCNLYFQTQDAAYEDRILNLLHQKAYDELAKEGKLDKAEKNAKAKASNSARARAWMCSNFFDVRTFGAVMTTGGFNCGQVRGATQITFARSIDPIVPLEIAITRKSVTTEEEAKKQAEKEGYITGTMGRKNTVPYALYRGYGFVNPFLAKDTGFTYGDLRLFFDSMMHMFELDRSASRGLMTLRKLVIFEHATALGNAPAHVLFDLLSIPPLGAERAPRRFEDYSVSLDKSRIPQGVTVHELPGSLDGILSAAA